MSKIYVNVCGICGKKFPTRYEKQKYCGKRCKYTAIEIRNEENRKRRVSKRKEQPCWTCQRATGKEVDNIACPWCRDFLPVDNWVAEISFSTDPKGYDFSYDIKSCPLYIKDAKR